MKSKEWLAKYLALGLAITTAVTSLGVPGGLLAPQTAYAAEEVEADGITAPDESEHSDGQAEHAQDEGSSDGSDEVEQKASKANSYDPLPNNVVVKYNELFASSYKKTDKFNVNVTVTAQTNDGKQYIISDDENNFEGKTTNYIIQRPNDGEHDEGYGDVNLIKTLYFKEPGSDASSTIYQKQINIYFDVIAPVLTIQEPTVTDKMAEISVTSSEDVTGYYMVTEGETKPDAETIKKHVGNDYQTTLRLSANEVKKITIGDNYAPESTRYVYVVAEDYAGNFSEVKAVSFTTRKTYLSGAVFIKTNNGDDISTLTVGDTIQAKYENGNATNLKYQWYRMPKTGAEVAIEAANEATYTVVPADDGCKLKVVVSDDDFFGTKSATTNQRVEKIDYTGEEPTFGNLTGTGSNKIIKINAPEGALLQYSLDRGTTWKNLTETFIPLGNKSYDVGQIGVRVGETDNTKPSDAVFYSESITGTLEGDAAITGTIKSGEQITATVTGAQDNAKLKYQFFRVKDGKDTSVEGASTENTYTLTKDDVGSTIKVKVIADNYDGEIVSDETAVVPKLKHDALALIVRIEDKAVTGGVTDSITDGAKTVTIQPVDGAEYSFDGGKNYSDKYTEDFVVADHKEPITVAIRYKDDEKYEPVATVLTQTFDLTKPMPEAPEVTLEAAVNAAKTACEIKVTASDVSEGETLEYSTDGNTYTTLDKLTAGLAANTAYTLYVRRAATDTANASSGTVRTITTPDVSAAPAISGEKNFKEKTNVTITAADGAEIYYTTDGKTPTIESTKYTGAIEVSATTTVKAIAVEGGKLMSAAASETFTKEASSSGEQGGSSAGGSGSSSAATPSKDETKKDVTTKTETKPDGTQVTTTETKAADGSVETKIELKNEKTGVEATVSVTKDAKGSVTAAEVVLRSDDNRTTIPAAAVAQITEAAGTRNVEITVKTVDANDKLMRKVTVNASRLIAGEKVKVVMVDPQTGEKTLVNKTSYKVAEDGSLVLDDLGNDSYRVVTLTEANALTKEILKTVKPQKTKQNLTVGKKNKFAFDDALNMENVAKITYKTDKKSIATVNANGTITAKKAGKVTIKAVVTLKNGKKKTVKMTITVKKKKK